MSDPLHYIESYFVNLKNVMDRKPELSSSEQADLAFADTCEVIGIYGTYEDLKQITQIHTDYKLVQTEKERINYEQSRTAV